MRLDLQITDRGVAQTLTDLCHAIRAAGGRALLVGGCVRDALLGLPAKDFDLECYGVGPEQLLALLQSRHRVDVVGRAFGVIKLAGLPIDVSLPRRESKAGLGHKGFSVQADPGLSFAEAARRRDFTFNAILYDPLKDELIDPENGQSDLRSRILRHTSDQFADDPLRVLRGMQFAARFELSPDPATVALCRHIHPEGLSAERVFDEWRKLILLGVRPSLGLRFLQDTGWVRYTPELEALIGCPQDPGWHPEGDVWVHTLHCLDAFARQRIHDPAEDLIVGLAVLCHDLGKPPTTRFEDGRIRSRGHDEAGVELTQSFLGRMTLQADLIEAVAVLVAHHLRPDELFNTGAGDAAIRRLARRVRRIDRLVRVARADRAGRPPRPAGDFPAGDWLLDRARALEVASQAPSPLILGRHLIHLGASPGPHFSSLLATCFEAQLEGRFHTLEDGLAFARQLLKQNGPGC